MRSLLLLATMLVGVSCSPTPTLLTPLIPVLHPSATYYTQVIQPSYYYVADPTPTLIQAVAGNRVSSVAQSNDKPRLYTLACYVLPYYESPYLSLLCLIGLIGGSFSERPAPDQNMA